MASGNGADDDADQDLRFAAGGAPAPASQAEVAALNLRVAALENQFAELTRSLALSQSGSSQAPSVTHPPAVMIPVQASSHSALPPPRIETVLAPPPPAVPRKSFEDRLGSQVFNFIGMAALIIGASWALKLAFEHGLIGPAGRIIIGLAAGIGLVLWSERFRRKGFAAFSYSLKAVGSGVLYLSLWAAFQLYHLLPPSVAFGAMVLVTAWNAFMAWSQDAELLAAYALAGGFATPLLLSTGGDHEAFLFCYVATIDAASALLIRWKPWRRLLLPAYAATAVYFIGWYNNFFHRGGVNVWDSQSAETALFTVLFFLIFAVVSLRGWSANDAENSRQLGVIGGVLIPLGNAAFIGCALYSVLQDSGLHTSLAWLMVVLAAVYLGLVRLQAGAVAAAVHLAMAVIFLTIALPLKTSGHTLTTAWLVEGLVLYWVAGRMKDETRKSAKVLWFLSAAGYALGLVSLVIHWFWFTGVSQPFAQPAFFNANLGSAMVAVATLAGTVWLATNTEADAPGVPPPARTLIAALVAIDLVAVLLTLRELGSMWSYRWQHPAFANPDFATALVGLAILAAASWVAYRLGAQGIEDCTVVAGGTLVAFNLLTILTFVREIGALWPPLEASSFSATHIAETQRSLAVSGFLMVYGAALLAAGFWRRSAFVRWQALILLIFTILKVFFDVGGLGPVYRVASFLGLGALLMAVSFAYQKDWLGLRAPAPGGPQQQPAQPRPGEPA